MAGWYTYFLRNKGVFLIPLGGFLFMILAAYPGFMSPDSLDQYRQALAGRYTDWHPPILAWIWQKMLWIVNGPQPMLVLINLLYWSGVALLAAGMEQRRYWVYISAFLPPLINFLGVIWKDSLMFAILVFTCSLYVYIQQKSSSSATRKRTGVCVLILWLIAACLRYNAIAALFPLLGLMLSNRFPRMHWFKLVTFACCSVILMFGVAMTVNRLITTHRAYPLQQTMLNDLMGINYYSQDVEFPEYVTTRVDRASLPWLYKPSDGAVIMVFGNHCVSAQQSDIDELEHDWIQAIRKHPVNWLHHKWWAFKEVQKSSLPVYYYMEPNPFGFELHRNMFNQAFRSYVDNPLTRRLYHGWIYLGLTFAVCLLSFLFRKRQGMWLAFFIALSGLLYSLAYLPLSPANDFRYHYWVIGSAWIGALLFVKSFFNTKPVY